MISTADNTDTREYLFDNMKAILIFLVVFAHVMNASQYPFISVRTLYFFIYFFHMPAFLFISGYFSKNVDKCRETALRTYFIPYVIINSISFLQMKYVIMSPDELLQFRIFTPLFGCWFLLFLFVIKLLLKDLVKIRFILILLFLFGIFAGFSHEFSFRFTLGRLSTFAIFFVAGYFTKREHIEKIRKLPKVIFVLLTVIVGVVSYFIAKSNAVPLNQTHGKTYYRTGLEMNDMWFRILLYIFAFLMIMVLISLIGNKKCFLTKIGSNSIMIYIMHLFVVRFINLFLEENDILYNSSAPVYLGAVFAASIVITYVFSRSWFLNGYNFVMNMIKCIIFKDFKK